MSKLNFNSDQSRKRIAHIQEVLRGNALTQQEIADAIFISVRHARDYIKYLQEIGCIYIADFRKGDRPGNYRHYVPLYRWGMGADAIAPEVRSAEEQDADERLDRAAALKKAKSIQPFRDWSAAWIPTRGQA